MNVFALPDIVVIPISISTRKDVFARPDIIVIQNLDLDNNENFRFEAKSKLF